MKFILLLTIVVTIICLTQAVILTRKNLIDSLHPGKCVFGGNVLEPGQIVKHPTINCAQITCLNADGMATVETCDPISVLSSPVEKLNDADRLKVINCSWGVFKNSRAQFPKCCERYINCLVFENDTVSKIVK